MGRGKCRHQGQFYLGKILNGESGESLERYNKTALLRHDVQAPLAVRECRTEWEADSLKTVIQTEHCYG